MAFLNSKTPLGFELPSVSRQFSVEMFKSDDEKTIHNDQAAAEREGLPAPVAVGPQVAALIFRMMHSCFEEGWIKGGNGRIVHWWIDRRVFDCHCRIIRCGRARLRYLYERSQTADARCACWII